MLKLLSSGDRNTASFWQKEQTRCMILCKSMFRVHSTKMIMLPT
jgi:hypothetical protein